MWTNKPKDLKQFCHRLSTALANGDKETAVEIVENLASNGVKCRVRLNPSDNKEEEFSIKVHLEDKDNSGGIVTCTLKVKSTDTLQNLKEKMCLENNFPVGIQRWVIGNSLPQDTDTLKRLNVVEGSTMFLYLAHTASEKTKTEKMKERLLEQIAMEKTVQGHSQGQASGLSSSPNQAVVKPSVGHKKDEKQNEVRKAEPCEHSASPETVQGLVTGQNVSGSKNVPVGKITIIQEKQFVFGSTGQRPEEHISWPVACPSIRQVRETSVVHHLETLVMTSPPEDKSKKQTVGWTCPACTFVNQPSRPGCEICSAQRPADYKIPDNYVMTEEEKQRIRQEQESEQEAQRYEAQRREQQLLRREENFNQLLAVEEQHLIPNTQEFDCPICFDTIEVGDGVVLRECLHSFCRNCLQAAVQHNEEPVVRCPYMDTDTACNEPLQQREIKALVPVELFDKYLQRSLSTAESQEINSFHCKTPDCPGWCIYEDMVNFFQCPVCNHENCLTCKAIHTGLNCKEYQEDLVIRARNDEDARNTQLMLENMVKSGNAMYCPGCKVIVQKKDGCDWIRCSICKLEICWVTKGPRWGPLGTGDISGGCGCRIGGRRCHPNCNNCH